MSKCKTCRFYEPVNATQGLCRINPPVILPGTMPRTVDGKHCHLGVWPGTKPDGWCGQHKGRDE